MMRVRGGKAASSETARWERLILWGIVVLAVVLRAWGLSHQLPDKTYIEEDEFIYTALKYGSGDPNPHWFFHPPLYSYLLFALYGAYYLLGAAAGWFRGAEEFILQYLVDPSAFYIIARGLSVLLSVPAVLLLHRFGRNVCSPRVGLAACLLFAVMPLGVKYAHYGCTEPLLLCLVLAAAVCAARALQTGRVRPLLAAGAFAGAAMGTKYTGAFALALVAAAVPPPTRVSSWAALLGAFAAAGAAFLLVCPFPILAPQEFAANVSLLASQPLQVGEYSWQRIPNLYLEFARRHMPVGMTAPLAWISLAGTVFLWLRHRREDILVAALPTAFYLVIGRSRLFYDRYMLVCYPFFALAAAALLDAAAARAAGLLAPAAARPRRAAALLAAAAVALALGGAGASARLVRLMVLPETRFLAARWIEEHLPAEARILADDAPVPQTEESVRREQRLKEREPRQEFGYREKTGLYFDLQRRAARGRRGFDVTRILHPRGFHMLGGGRGYEEEWMTPERMKAQLESIDDYDYVLASSTGAYRYRAREILPERFRFLHDFYAGLAGRGTVVKVFRPEPSRSTGPEYTLYRVGEGR
ncbi:MAG: glycosyltransferase family 39 protein [Candidatus Aureabacteria bacterium]|nr:glycosyltransferase family 39 protein [Candidatus Auribacterota bacterium]NLW93869.1 hypothetical protein [Chlamydiota bacterium]HOE27786.1 glycosyltransferase family 39 protein [bacterium]HQM53047.1 glycosyltransferase family 39 protein [bacterium]